MAEGSTTAECMPAVIFYDETGGDLRVAALTLLDRLVVVLHRACCSPITIVCRETLPDLRRSRAWRIPFHVVPAPPTISSPTLVARSCLLVQLSDIRTIIEQRCRLATPDGTPLPVGVVGGPTDAPLNTIEGLPTAEASGVVALVNDRASARLAERALWASLTSSSDGFVDKHFNRPCGRPLSKLLIRTPVTANAVSIASSLIGLIAACCFAAGSYAMSVLGAVLFQVSAIIDCVDGDVARAVFKESPLGKWLDFAGDQVVHVAVFAAIAVGLSRQSSEAPVFWLGISAVAGALFSFAVVVRGMKQVADKNNTLLRRLIDAATNRDFSVLVLALALLEKLELFLWLTAIGSHLFWVTLLCLQWFFPKAARAGVPSSQ